MTVSGSSFPPYPNTIGVLPLVAAADGWSVVDVPLYVSTVSLVSGVSSSLGEKSKSGISSSLGRSLPQQQQKQQQQQQQHPVKHQETALHNEKVKNTVTNHFCKQIYTSHVQSYPISTAKAKNWNFNLGSCKLNKGIHRNLHLQIYSTSAPTSYILNPE